MEISRVTEFPNELEGILAIPILIIGIICFFLFKKFRPYSIGLTTLSIYFFIFLVFYMNKNLATKGKYESFEIRGVNWGDDGFYLHIGFNMWYNSTEVTQQKCLDVDSVQVRVNNGFFGMRTMSNDVRIIECFHCDSSTVGINPEIDYLEIGKEFFHKRCFTKAIEIYSKGIKLDSLKPYGYYLRGLSNMAIEDYENALIDFLTSAYLDYNKLNRNDVQVIDECKMKSFKNQLLKELEDENSKIIRGYIDKFNSVGYFDSYLTRIEFCKKNLKSKLLGIKNK